MAIPSVPLRYQTLNGQVWVLTEKLGSGGEGDIYAVEGQGAWAAKIYAAKNRTVEREEKLRYMAAHPPAGPFGKHISFAWPLELLYGPQKNFVGFLMPKLEVRQTLLLFQVYHPAEARKRGLSWRFRMAVAHNLATVLEELHNKHYIVGDLNESNFLVHRDGLVTLVDCDSVQVQTDTGQLFHCRVQKPEFTPPELQGQSYADISLKAPHDNFSLAILVFQLLMEGRHPFAGRGVQTPDEGIRMGKSVLRGLEPVVGTPSPNILPPPLRRLFLQAFGASPPRRPQPKAWKQALQSEFEKTQQCKTVPQHWYSSHLKGCPWCNPQIAEQDRQSQIESLRQTAADLQHQTAQWLLAALPFALPIGIFLGLFRQALALHLGLQSPQSLETLYRFVGTVSVHTLLGNFALSLVPFFAAGLMVFIAWVSAGHYRVWPSLLALIVLPYFVLPLALEHFKSGSKALEYGIVGLHFLLLIPAQIALAVLAIPGLLVMGALDFYSAKLSSLGLPLGLGWFGLGVLIGLTIKALRQITNTFQESA